MEVAVTQADHQKLTLKGPWLTKLTTRHNLFKAKVLANRATNSLLVISTEKSWICQILIQTRVQQATLQVDKHWVSQTG